MERIKAANILEEDGLEYASRILGEEQISSGSGITRLERAGLLSNHQAKLLRCNEDNRLRFGDFVLLEKIGKGGGGFVFRARRIGSAQFVALKVLARPQQRQRFEREMRIVKKLSHPHIVVAYDVGYARQSMFISMELINGPNLSTIVRESGPITPTKAFHYVLQAASALEHAHARGLIHRDVKPGNLMVCGNDLIKLADLGLARLLEADGSSSDYETDVGQLGGTIEFMAPEQAISLSDADERSDIYALGATLYFMLAGRTLLKGETFNEKVQNLTNYKRFHRISDLNLPQAELSILRRMVAYEPENRFASCHDLIDAIKSIQGGQETTGAVTIRLLVVEDNRVDFMATLRYLGKINKSIETHHADSLADAEVRFREDGPFDLVLLDLNLPDSRGPNTVQSFRDGTNTRIPLIVLTGLRDPNIDSQALAAGANSILSKDQLNAETLERHIFVTLSQHAAAH